MRLRFLDAVDVRVGKSQVVGDLVAVEEIFALKLLMQSLGVTSLDCRQDGSKLDPKFGATAHNYDLRASSANQFWGGAVSGYGLWS